MEETAEGALIEIGDAGYARELTVDAFENAFRVLEREHGAACKYCSDTAELAAWLRSASIPSTIEDVTRKIAGRCVDWQPGEAYLRLP